MNLTPQQRATIIEAARQTLAVRSLAGFVRYMWSDCPQTSPLVWGPHFEVLCQELEWLSEGRAKCLACWGEGCEACGDGWVPVDELVVNIPPGHGKSVIASVLFPAWLWLRDPRLYLLTLANTDTLATRDSARMREVIKSENYKTLQRRAAIEAGGTAEDEIWGLSAYEAAKVRFQNTVGGGRDARGLTSIVTGARCNGLIVDDPHDAKEIIKGKPARVVERMREARDVYFSLDSRLNRGAWKLVIMQRLHKADLAGELIEDGGEGTRIVCLPVRYDPDHPQRHPLDNRAPDEWLCEAAFSEEKEAERRRRLTPRHYRAQYGQSPTSDEGGTFHRRYFEKRYQGAPEIFVGKLRADWVEVSVDCTFKDLDSSDFVTMQIWAHKRSGPQAGRYALGQVRGRMDLVETCVALRDFVGKWSQYTTINRVSIEDKANGPGVISVLKREGTEKLTAWSPDKYGSKEARAAVAAVSWEAGDCWLPADAPWVADFIEEHVSFPAAPNDDQVDCASMIQIRWDEMQGQGGDINAGLAWADLL